MQGTSGKGGEPKIEKVVSCMSNEWESELTPSMLPEGIYRNIAETIGVSNLLKLSALVGGSTFYLPQQKQLLKTLRDIKIREEYNGYNTLELSRKYKVSERWVRGVINQKNKKEDN